MQEDVAKSPIINNMQIITEQEIIKKIRNYEFGDLWNIVENVKEDSDLTKNEKILLLSLKAMLLGGWWQDHQSAKKLLTNIKVDIAEQTVCFLLSYAYLSVGELELCKQYFKQITQENKWMREWLDLEWQGRSKQYIEQSKKIEEFLKTRKKLDNTHKIALLQSLDHTGADIKYLKKIFTKNKLNKSKNPFDMALSIRLSLMGKSTILELYSKDIAQPFLLYRVSHSLISNLEIKSFLDSFDKLLETKFINIYTLLVPLMIVMSFTTKEKKISYISRARSISPKTLYVQGALSAFELIHYWLQNDVKTAIGIYNKYRNFLMTQTSFTDLTKNGFIFYSYLGFLIDHRAKHMQYYKPNVSTYKNLYIIGESHSLSPANMFFSLNDSYYFATSLFIMGCKMHHFSKPNSSYMSKSFKYYIESLPAKSDIMLTIGEIDTRTDEGIWKAVHEKSLDINTVIDETVGGYIEFLKTNLKDKNLNSVTIQGIPAPAYPLEGDKDPKDKAGFLNMIKKVNEKLKELTLAQNYNFLDVYSATVDESGISNKQWHLDGYHLQPIFYTQANKWLITPKQETQTKKKQEPSTAIDFSKIQTLNLSKP